MRKMNLLMYWLKTYFNEINIKKFTVQIRGAYTYLSAWAPARYFICNSSLQVAPPKTALNKSLKSFYLNQKLAILLDLIIEFCE